jgi:hypothetical protein
MRRMAGLLFTAGLAAGFGADMTAIAHASDPVRPAQAWNEIFLPFDNGKGNTLCVDAAGARRRLSRCHGYARNGGPQRWQFSGRFSEVSNTDSGRLVQERCDQTPPWQQVRQSRDSTDPYFRLETSGSGGPALCMAAGDLGDNDQTPLVAASCQGFGSAAEILELG